MEPPDLPDTDDPFELLQIEPTAGERDVKRAYVRLIKRFRPDRDADAFMRIQSAYESALAMIRWRRYEVPAPDGAGDTDASDAARDGAASDDDASDGTASDDAASDDSDEAKQPADGPGPLDPPWGREVAAALERGDEAEAIEQLARVFADNQSGAAEYALDALSADALSRLAVRPELAWDHLREQSNRWAALEIFGMRVDELLMRNEARVVGEISTPAFRRDLLGEPMLERFALDVILRAAWEGDPRASRLYTVLGESAVGRSHVQHERTEDALGLAGAWCEFKALAPCPLALERLVVLFGSVGIFHRARLLHAMDVEISRNRRGLIAALDAMDRFDPRLLDYVHELVGEMTYGDEERLEEIAKRESAAIARALRQADLQLRSGSRSGPAMLAAGAGAAVAYVALPAGFGLLGAAGILFGVGFWQMLPEDGSYYRNARPHLCRIVAETGIEPHRILEWLRANSSRVNRFRLEFSIESDLPLATFGRLARLCLAWRP